MASSKPDPGTQYFDAGSQQDTADLIAAQDRARTESSSPVKRWAPWVIGGVLLGSGIYLLLRD